LRLPKKDKTIIGAVAILQNKFIDTFASYTRPLFLQGLFLAFQNISKPF
jgi:hypothetical protein